MRKIKFRAWDGKQMISPDYVDRNGVAYWKENSVTEWSKIVMQYTGLKDRNGVEIYEGDEVIDENSGDTRIVKWSEQNAQFYLSHIISGKSFYKEFLCCGQYRIGNDPVVCDTITVIGNIHTKTDSNVQP